MVGAYAYIATTTGRVLRTSYIQKQLQKGLAQGRLFAVAEKLAKLIQKEQKRARAASATEAAQDK